MKRFTALVLILFAFTSANTTTYYLDDVATSGDGTFANPFNHFDSVMALLYPGDTLLVMPGLYADVGRIFTHRGGTVSDPIVIAAYDPNDRPVFERSGNNVLINTGHPYIIVDGFVFDALFGVNIVIRIKADWCTIRNCEVKNNKRDGVVVQNADNVLLENLEIHHMLNGSITNQADAHGIAAENENYLTIRGCNIYYNSGDCFQTDPSRSRPLWDNVLIEDSRLWTGPLPDDAAGWHAGEIPGENAIDTKIKRDSAFTSYFPKLTLINVESYGFRDGGIGDPAAFNLKEKLDCKMTNIKVYDNKNAFRIRGTWGSAHLTLINCIAYDNTRVFRTEDNVLLLHIYNGTFDKEPGGVYFQNVSGGYDPAGFDLRNSLFMGTKPADAFDPSNFSADSSYFVDAANRDYHLSPTSPAIDAGVDIPEVTTDFEGNPRVSGGYDIGAYEAAQTLLTFTQDVLAGWNLIGLPLQTTDRFYKSVYPGAVDNTLFGFNGSYILEDSLKFGNGYWLRFPSDTTVSVPGTPVDSITLLLSEGWNIISGLSCDVPINSVVDPDSIIIPLTLFGFNGSYIQTDTIRQGNGYWLRADTAGQVTLSCGAAQQPLAKVSIQTLDLDAFPALKIWDGSGAAQTLYFNVSIKEKTKRSYSLPPLPPAGAFDARFEGDYRINQKGEGIIRLQSDHFPVTIIPSNLDNGKGIAYALQEIIAGMKGSTHILHNGSRMEITNPNVTSLRLSKTESLVPVTFEVKQNYPNPFNPSTTIKYAIPQQSKVDIIIYNTLGQKVKTLVTGTEEAGFHEVVWDATNEAGLKVGSGIFFYTVKAGDQRAVRKMILVR